jgi:hypothetical protein
MDRTRSVINDTGIYNTVFVPGFQFYIGLKTISEPPFDFQNKSKTPVLECAKRKRSCLISFLFFSFFIYSQYVFPILKLHFTRRQMKRGRGSFLLFPDLSFRTEKAIFQTRFNPDKNFRSSKMLL